MIDTVVEGSFYRVVGMIVWVDMADMTGSTDEVLMNDEVLMKLGGMGVEKQDLR